VKSRLTIVLLSIVFAAIATFGAAYYIADLKASITEGQELVEVVVAKKPAAAGSSVAEMYASGTIALQKVPKQYVAEGAISSITRYSDKAISSDLVKGEQLTTSKFKKVDQAALAYKVPENMVAVSIAVDEVTGVGGRLQPGDRVDVIATFSPGPGNRDMTKIMLQNIEILVAAGSDDASKNTGLVKNQQSSPGKKTVTLVLTPHQAEKLVFAAEKGHVWLGLRHTGNEKHIQPAGQTVETVFN